MSTHREQLLKAVGEDPVLRHLAWEPYEPQGSFYVHCRDNAIVAEVVPGQANVQVLFQGDKVEWEVCGPGGRDPLEQARGRLSRSVAAMRPDLAVHEEGLDGKDFLTEIADTLKQVWPGISTVWRSHVERLLDAYAAAASGLTHYLDRATKAEAESLRLAAAAEEIKKERDGAVARMHHLEDAIAEAKSMLGGEGRRLCETAWTRMKQIADGAEDLAAVREALQAGLGTEEHSVRALAVAACALLRAGRSVDNGADAGGAA